MILLMEAPLPDYDLQKLKKALVIKQSQHFTSTTSTPTKLRIQDAPVKTVLDATPPIIRKNYMNTHLKVACA